MTGKNVHWFAGDRFACVNRKIQTLKNLSKEEEWAIHDVTKMKTDKICSLINSCPLFGAMNIALVCDGVLKDPQKICDILLRLPDDRAFILLDPKVDKRSIVYKKLKSKIEVFDLITKEGHLDEDGKELAKKTIKEITGWLGKIEIFDYIFEACGYDVGITVSEIEKIRIYIGSEVINEISEVEKVLCRSNLPDIDDLIRSVFNSNVGMAFGILSQLINSVKSGNYAFEFFTGMINRLIIIAYSCLVFEEGIETNKEASEIISKRLEMGGKKVNSYYILNRINAYEDIISSTDSKKVFKSISRARSGIDDLAYGRGNPDFLMKKFVYSIL